MSCEHIVYLTGNKKSFDIKYFNCDTLLSHVSIKNWETIERINITKTKINTDNANFFEQSMSNITKSGDDITIPNFIKIVSYDSAETYFIEQIEQFPEMFPCKLIVELSEASLIIGDFSVSTLNTNCKQITISKTLITNVGIFGKQSNDNCTLIILREGKLQTNDTSTFDNVNILNNGVMLCRDKLNCIKCSLKNEKDGFIDANSLDVHETKYENHGEMVTKKFEQQTGEFSNYGLWFHEGKLTLGNLRMTNDGTIEWKNTQLNAISSLYGHNNYGDWTLDNVCMDVSTSEETLFITNKKTLQLKNSTLNFNWLLNYGNLIFHSGKYKIFGLQNWNYGGGLMSLLNGDWILSDLDLDTKGKNHPNMIVSTGFGPIGSIEVEKSLTYSVKSMPDSLTVGQNLVLSQQQSLTELATVKCGGTVNMRYNIPLKTIPSQCDVSNINHLSLFILGDLTNTENFKVSSCTLNIKGSFTNMGTIQTIVGNLEIHADGIIDNTKGKMNSKGNLVLRSGKDILNGEAKSGGSFLYTFNGSYIASCGTLTLAANGAFTNKYGQVFSSKPMSISGDSISIIAGDVACADDITFSSKTFNVSRDSAYTVAVGNWTWAYSGCYNYCESSDQSVVRSLGSIYFKVDQGTVSASSILAQKEIKFKHKKEKSETRFPFGTNGTSIMKPEMPATFTSCASTLWGYGCNDKVGYQRGCSPVSSYPAVIQAGEKVTIDTDKFTMSGNMSSPVIKIQCKSADFDNQVRYRNNVPLLSMYIDLTKFIQERVSQTLGFLRNKDGNVECDIPLKTMTLDTKLLLIEEGDECGDEGDARRNVPHFLNPLKNLPSDFMELFIQSALSIYAGKLHLNGKGNTITEKLLNNSDLFQQETHKITMNKKHENNPKYAMLLNELTKVNNVIQKNTILYLPSNEINPFQSHGDISANEFECKTTENQTHANNRIVARDILCVIAKNVTRRTESYISVNYVNGSKITEDIAMPKQTFICLNGDIEVKATETISSTGTTTIGNNVIQKAKYICEKPLVLHKVVETRCESGSVFNKKESLEVDTTHTIVANESVAKNDITKQAERTILQQSTHDVAGHKAEYSAKTANVTGLILNNSHERQCSESNGFTERSSKVHKETPTFHSASITAPLTIFMGETAVISGCEITGNTIEDHTNVGVKFSPVVGEIKYFAQETTESALSGVDAGCEGGSTVLLQCKLDVEKIIRTLKGGEMLFDSVIWKQKKAEFIGKTAEITTEIRQWHTSWCKIHQTVPDGAIVIASLAVSFATYGTGATLMGGLTGTWGAMSSAAFTTLCNAAVTTFLKNGDPIMSAKSLITNDFYRTLAINVASAGIIDFGKLNVRLDANATILDYTKYAALRSIVNVPLACVIGKRELNDVLTGEAANIATETITGYSASKIGLMYRNGDLSFMNHKFFHGIVGSISGSITNTILNKDVIEGALSGAIGAVVSEFAGELIPINGDSIDQMLFTSKVIAGSVALLMGQDVNLAVKIASVTVENNLWPCLVYLNAVLVALGVTHAAKDAMDVYEETEDVNDAVDTFMLHGIIMAAVNGTVRFGGRMFGMFKNAWKSGGVGLEATNMTASVVNKDLLHHQLSLQEKMGEVGTSLAGAGTNVVFRNEPFVVAQYEGKIGEWVKKSSSDFVTRGGKKIEVHWVENVKTGQRVEFKQKITK